MSMYMYRGKIIGELSNGVLIKKGKQVVLMRALDAFGIPEEVVNDSKVKEIHIHYGDTIYKASTKQLKEYGWLKSFGGYEPQYFMPRGKNGRNNSKDSPRQGRLL